MGHFFFHSDSSHLRNWELRPLHAFGFDLWKIKGMIGTCPTLHFCPTDPQACLLLIDLNLLQRLLQYLAALPCLDPQASISCYLRLAASHLHPLQREHKEPTRLHGRPN